MKKSKKGFTMIELIIGMMVLSLAVIAGSQLFSAASNGHTRAAAAHTAVETLASAFDSGDSVMPNNVFYEDDAASVVKVTVKGKVFSEQQKLIKLNYADKIARVQLFGLECSYGSGN